MSISATSPGADTPRNPAKIALATGTVGAVSGGFGLAIAKVHKSKEFGIILGSMMASGTLGALAASVVANDSKYPGVPTLVGVGAATAGLAVALHATGTKWAETVVPSLRLGMFFGLGAAAGGHLAAQYVGGIPNSAMKATS
jgi:hypothetical protein